MDSHRLNQVGVPAPAAMSNVASQARSAPPTALFDKCILFCPDQERGSERVHAPMEQIIFIFSLAPGLFYSTTFYHNLVQGGLELPVIPQNVALIHFVGDITVTRPSEQEAGRTGGLS